MQRALGARASGVHSEEASADEHGDYETALVSLKNNVRDILIELSGLNRRFRAAIVPPPLSTPLGDGKSLILL